MHGLEGETRSTAVGLAAEVIRLTRIGRTSATYECAAYRMDDDVLMVTGLSAGDFVRWMKQLLDLCGQVADAAGEQELRDTARATARLLKRGVIAYSVLAE